jgi:CHAD domain-containing protein
VGESRAPRLEPGEPLPEGMARIARGRIDHALEELRGNTGSTPGHAVHEARKDMKKLRALLGLARGELGERTYASENACFRDAARELAGARDADVILATLKALELRDGLGRELRRRIHDGHSEQRSKGREAAARGAVAILGEARGRIDDWPLERDSFAALSEGLERTYRRGRREFGDARAGGGTEALHEWRKRVKQLWYHASLLRCAWPPVMTAFADEAHELSGRLGEDHDLALLAGWVWEHVGHEPELVAAVEDRRERLQSEAFALGGRLYAEKPSAYVRRIERLWDAGRAGVRAP